MCIGLPPHWLFPGNKPPKGVRIKLKDSGNWKEIHS